MFLGDKSHFNSFSQEIKLNFSSKLKMLLQSTAYQNLVVIRGYARAFYWWALHAFTDYVSWHSARKPTQPAEHMKETSIHYSHLFVECPFRSSSEYEGSIAGGDINTEE